MTDELTLPHSAEVEGAIVARLLTDPAQLPLIASQLSQEDFYDRDWGRAFDVMQRLSSERKAVDVVTVGEVLGTGKDVDLRNRLREIGQFHRAPAAEYARLIRRDAFRRRLIGTLEGVTRKAYIEESQERLLASLHDAILQVSQGIGEDRLVSPAQAVENYWNVLQARQSGLRPGLAYGLAGLDHLLAPAQGGEVILIAARPSVGKTSLAEHLADSWASTSDLPVLFASLEMRIPSLMDRALARSSGLDATAILRGRLNAEDLKMASTYINNRRDVRIWYMDDPHATTTTIRATAAKLRILAGGLAGVVVDYIQLLKDENDNEVQRVTRISREIKAISLEFDVPILALSQLSRAVMQREDQHPKLHDLRESGALEQDADVVIGMHRILGNPQTDIEVLKARQGPVGTTRLYFDTAHARFMDMAKWHGN